MDSVVLQFEGSVHSLLLFESLVASQRLLFIGDIPFLRWIISSHRISLSLSLSFLFFFFSLISLSFPVSFH